MPRPEGSAQLGLTMPAQMKEDISNYAQSKGMSVNEFMRQAAKESMTNDLQTVVPERAQDIQNFFDYIHGLTNIFSVAVQAEKNAEATERAKVQSQLNALEGLTQQNRQQQDEIKKLQAENEKLRMDLEKTKSQLDDQKTLQQDIQKTSAENVELKKENAKLKEQLAEEKLAHANDVDKINKESWDKILQALSLKAK